MIKSLVKMLLKAGVPESEHAAFETALGSFATVLVTLVRVNKDVAPNYLTFALRDELGDLYEITVGRCEGLSPAQKLVQADKRITELEKTIRIMKEEALDDSL